MKKLKSAKKFLCILLSCLFIFASFAAIGVSAAEATSATGTAIALGNSTVKLDGVIDDVWKNAPAHELSLRNGTSNDTVSLRFLWDNDFLYILADIKDSTPHTSNEKWWNRDAIEFLICINSSGTQIKKMHLQRSGTIGEQSGSYFKGTSGEKDVFWGSWKCPRMVDNGENGWVVEYAIPLNNSEGNPANESGNANETKLAKKSVTVDCLYYSADSSSTNRTGVLGWTANGVVDSNNATLESLGKVLLSDESVITTKLTGASITVGSDLTMNYYVDVTDDKVKADLSKLSMRFSMNGIVKTVNEYSTVGGEYVFAFDGIAPQNMGDNIKAELLYDNKVIDVKDYSVKENAAQLLADNSNNEKLVRFVTDMLNYGAAAQTYTNYKTDALVNANVSGMAVASTVVPSDSDKPVLTGNETVGVKINSESLVFDGVIKLSFELNISADKVSSVKIKLDGTEIALADLENLGNGSYVLVTDEIMVTGFDKIFTLVLMDGNVEAAKLQYSVNSYAFSMKDDAQNGSFALNLYRLGTSADAYNAQ